MKIQLFSTRLSEIFNTNNEIPITRHGSISIEKEKKRKPIRASYGLLTLLLLFSFSAVWAQQQAVYVNPPVSGDRYQDIPFAVDLIAVDAAGFALNDTYIVNWASNSATTQTGSESIAFANGAAQLTIELTTIETHTITVTVELPSVTDPTTDFTVDIAVNNADFTISGFADSGSPVTEITAGEDFDIELTSVLGIDGDALETGDYIVVVTTDEPSLVDGLAEVFNGPVTFTNNGTTTSATISITDEKVNKAASHTFTVAINELWQTKPSPTSLTVNSGDITQLILQSPLAIPTVEGNFDGQPAEIPSLTVITADKFKNQSLLYSGFDVTFFNVQISVSFSSNPTTAELEGFFQKSLIAPGIVVFDNLTVDKEGNGFQLQFSDNFGIFPVTQTNLFDVINIDNQSDFDLVDPGPQIGSTTFALYARNATQSDGVTLLNGAAGIDKDYTVSIKRAGDPVAGYPSTGTVSFSEGQASISLTVPDYSSSLSNNLTVDLAFDDINLGAAKTQTFTVTNPTDPDNSTFSLQIRTSPGATPVSGPVIIALGAPFSVLINGATDIQNDLISTPQLVTITDATEGEIFSDWLLFDSSGNAETPLDLTLSSTGVRDLTVEVYWVTDTKTIGVDIFTPGITIQDENSDDLTTSDINPLDLGSLIAGYDGTAASGAAETVKVARDGLTVDLVITGVSIANTTVFETANAPTWPQILNSSAPDRTFDVQPKTGVDPGTYTSLVTVSYAFNPGSGSITGSQSFRVNFTVDDSYKIKLYNVTDDTDDFSAAIDFGTREGDYTQPDSKTIRIDNDGTGEITDLAVVMGGSQPFGFEIINLGSETIPFEGNTTFEVRPKTDLGVGEYNATVNITANDGVTASFDVTFIITFFYSVDGNIFLGTFSDNYADFLSDDEAWFEFTVKNRSSGLVNPLLPTTKISLLLNANFELEPATNTVADGFDLFLSENVFPGDSATYRVKPKTGLPDGSFVFDAVRVDPNGGGVNIKVVPINLYIADIQWTGVSGTDWNNAGNWTYDPLIGSPPQTIPNNYVNVIIPDVTTDPAISEDVVANDLDIQSGAILTLLGSKLTVNEALAVSGELSVPNGATLETAAGSATTVTGLLNLASGGVVNNTGTFTLDNDVSSGGTFTNDGTLVNNAAHTLTVASGATLANSTGSIFTQDGTVTLTGTFANAGTTNNAGTFTHDGTGFTNLSDGIFNNNATGVFTVNAGKLLQNQGTFANADNSQLTVKPLGQITSETGAILSNSQANIDNFIVESDGLGSTGSVIINNTGAYASVERWLAASPSGTDQRYQMISSPVIGQDIESFLTGHSTLIANNGITYAMRKYLESATDWSALFTTGGSNNIESINGDTDFVPGAAYTTRLWSTPGAVVFKGELVNQTISITLAKTQFGWNGLGNPFPSSINAADFLTEYGSLLQANRMGLWIWNGEDKDYDIINSIPATPDQEYIALGQGFIVKTSANNNVVQLKDSYRVHQAPNFRKNAKNREDWVIMKLHVEDANSNSSKTLLAFHDEMTSDLDVGYDAGLFYEVNNDFLLYSIMPDGLSPDLRLLRQALYKDDIHNLMIPLGLVNTAGGNVEFSLESIFVPAGWIPVLYDADKNINTDLSQSNYTAIMAPGEPSEGRFFLNMQHENDKYLVTFETLGEKKNLSTVQLTEGHKQEAGQVTALLNGVYINSGESVPRGSDLLFQAFPAQGYSLSYWKLNGEIVADYNHTFFVVENITGNVIVEAAFTNKEGKDEPLSVSLDDIFNELQIYPWASKIVIKGDVGENTYASLYDMLGRRVNFIELNPGDYNEIDVSGFQAGTYMLRLNSNYAEKSVKLQLP